MADIPIDRFALSGTLVSINQKYASLKSGFRFQDLICADLGVIACVFQTLYVQISME